MTAVEAYEMALFARLLDGLGATEPRDPVREGRAARADRVLHGARAWRRARSPCTLAARGVNVWNGDNYAYELCTALGLEPDGAVRAGLVHYNDASDVDRLLAGVGELAS